MLFNSNTPSQTKITKLTIDSGLRNFNLYPSPFQFTFSFGYNATQPSYTYIISKIKQINVKKFILPKYTSVTYDSNNNWSFTNYSNDQLNSKLIILKMNGPSNEDRISNNSDILGNNCIITSEITNNSGNFDPYYPSFSDILFNTPTYDSLTSITLNFIDFNSNPIIINIIDNQTSNVYQINFNDLLNSSGPIFNFTSTLSDNLRSFVTNYIRCYVFLEIEHLR